MENFHHRECQKRHRHAVRAVDDFPAAGFQIMADEVGRQRQHRNHDALKRNIKAEAVRKNTVIRISRRAFHDVCLTVLHTERQRREAVRNQVDPEQMHRI